MATAGASTRLSVSLYLLRALKVSEAFAQLEAASASNSTLIDSIPEGKFLALPSDPSPPQWLAPISSLISANANLQLESQSPGGILWIPRNGKTFVFTFGYGHAKIKDDWVDTEFGKIVALTVVTLEQVREVRAEQVFARRHIANERAPAASSVREFGFESDRDLVTAVDGIPEASYWPLLGKRVRGGVSFKFDLDVSCLLETLDKIIERFDSNEHLIRWPEANNLVHVRDSDVADQLDAKLDEILSAPHPEKSITFAAPTERSGDKPYPQHFVIGRMQASPTTSPYLTYASWKSHVRSKGEMSDLNAARVTRVHLLDADEEEISSCSMYDCMGVEVTHEGTTYVLSSGAWYAANRQFIDSTNQVLETIDAPTLKLQAWNSVDHEGPYNEMAANADPDLWLFDKELVQFGGGSSRFEFCDLMHLPSKTLYFVKHPTRSAGVSHLSEQVRRTAETFFDTDPTYREKLAAKINVAGKGWDTTWLATQPKRHEWNLCLVLMGKPLSDLPFFAKCGISRLVGELRKSGFSLSFQTV